MGNQKTINEQNQKQVKSGLYNSMSFKCNEKLNDKYPGDVFKYFKFEFIQIHGVRITHSSISPRGTSFELTNENPMFYSCYVYLKQKFSFADKICVGDFGTYELAHEYAEELASKYSLKLVEESKTKN